MDAHLPVVYISFRDGHHEVAAALDALGAAVDVAGPLDERERRLVKLGIAIGRESDGAVRSNARKAMAAGVDEAALRHAALLAITTAGFPTAIAGLGWIDEVVTAGAD